MATDTLTPQTTSTQASSGGDAQVSSTPLDSRVKMQRNIQKLESSDFYKGLSPAKKVQVQTKFYNQFVKPAFKSGDSDLKTWLKGRAGKDTRINVEGKVKDVLNYSAKDDAEKVVGAVGSGTMGLLKTPLSFAEKATNLLTPNVAGKKEASDLTKKFIEDTYHKDDVWMEQHYDNSIKDSVLKEGGKMIGQIPAFETGGGILKGLGLTDLLVSGEAAKAMGPLARVGGKIVNSAVDGYLFGKMTGDDPLKSSAGFGAFGAAGGFGGELFSGVQKFVGRMLGVGGEKLVSEMAASTLEAVKSKAAETEVAPIVAGLAGSQKQKIHASTIQALNELTGGDFVRASDIAKMSAITKLEKIAPDMAGELGFINQNIVEAKAAAVTLKQRAMVPEFNQVLSDLEKIDGTPTPKAVAQSVADKAEKRQLVKVNSKNKLVAGLDKEQLLDILSYNDPSTRGVKPSQVTKTVPGAASSSSYEFEDNLSKRIGQGLDKLGLGKDKLVWEDRGHKLLFYLNLLLGDQKQLGASKERNKQFQFLMQHLNDRYKDATLPDLVKMSDNLWTHIEQLTKAGITEEGKPTRIFRQTEIRPGESPFGHQVKLLRDAQTHEINERMDIDAFNRNK